MAQEGGIVLDTGPVSVLCDAGSSIVAGGKRAVHGDILRLWNAL